MPIIYTDKKLRPRAKHDFYPTPLELAKTAIASLPYMGMATKYVLDAGAGTGIWGEAYREVYMCFDHVIGGVEIQDLPKPSGYNFWFSKTDYLDFDNWGLTNGIEYDLIVGNPPFRFAEGFVRRSLDLLKPGGTLLFLLPLNFLESEKRGLGLFKSYPPYLVNVSMRRVSFTGNKKADNTAYALYYWKKDSYGGTHLGWFTWKYEK